MYQDHALHYLSVGLSAIRCIEGALEKSESGKEIRSILDLPCGYGRVLRFLRVRFPGAAITVSEVDPGMLAFCRRTFCVNSIASDPDFNKIALTDRFDLIWCGSLITHIDETDASNLLKFFYHHLSPSGLCVFTTHGQYSVDSLHNGSITYGLTTDRQSQLLSGFREKGYGYADYEKENGYGISAVSHRRMNTVATSIGDWKETIFLERGWDNHQDVYGYENCERHP